MGQISGSGDGSLCLWDIQQGKQILTFAGHQSAVSSVACMVRSPLASLGHFFVSVMLCLPDLSLFCPFTRGNVSSPPVGMAT